MVQLRKGIYYLLIFTWDMWYNVITISSVTFATFYITFGFYYLNYVVFSHGTILDFCGTNKPLRYLFLTQNLHVYIYTSNKTLLHLILFCLSVFLNLSFPYKIHDVNSIFGKTLNKKLSHAYKSYYIFGLQAKCGASPSFFSILNKKRVNIGTDLRLAWLRNTFPTKWKFSQVFER